MSVHADERTKGKMLIHMKARDLAAYTITITRNQKIFKPEYNAAITDELVRLAIGIYQELWKANKIRVQGERDYLRRREHQETAIDHCESFIGLIDIAAKVFHLSGRRVGYWGGQINAIQSMAESWMESDRKRYQNLS